jgi:hypothetical protein
VTNLNTQFGGLGGADSSQNGYGYGGGAGGGDANAYGKNTFKLSKLRSANRSATTSANRGGESYADFTTRQAPASALDGRSDLYSYGVWTAPTTGIDAVSSKIGKRNVSALAEENPKADATSVGSNDSQRMIIRKDVTYEVHGI